MQFGRYAVIAPSRLRFRWEDAKDSRQLRTKSLNVEHSAVNRRVGRFGLHEEPKFVFSNSTVDVLDQYIVLGA